MNTGKHTMKIETFNRTNLAALRMDLDKAMFDLSKRYGVSIQTGSIRFSAGEATIKVVARATESKTVANQFIDLMKVKGLRANVEINGRTLVRYDRKKIKYPYIYSDKNGKMFKCSYEIAKAYFG